MPRIFAIGDLHLSLSVENKAMDVFGPGWANHVDRLREGWQDTVGEADLVLLPGDISWGLRLEEAAADLGFIHELKGTKRPATARSRASCPHPSGRSRTTPLSGATRSSAAPGAGTPPRTPISPRARIERSSNGKSFG